VPRRRSYDISAAEARRIALAAQGFGRPRPHARITNRHFERVLDHVGLVQIDSVNVLARAHYMPFFSRLGPYDRDALDRFTWGKGRLFEFWGHEASFIPVERYPLFRHRMEAGRRWSSGERFMETRSDHARQLIEVIRETGPVVVGDVNEGGSQAGWWEWSDAKRVLESLYTHGHLMVGNRRNFTRLYDLPERVLPAEVLDAPVPEPEEAQRELLRLSVAHHGIGTVRDLADYYRIKIGPARARLQDLLDAGEVEQVAVEGWREPAYLAPGTKIPRRIEARALLSPFDPVVWERARGERLFDFHYRIEIYTPEPKRQFGYYVLPFLLGDRIVGRTDLKADRASGTLLVQAAHIEEGHHPGEVAEALAAELHEMANWLGMERIVVRPRGALSKHLRAAVDAD
jgi:uncharacterized protein